MLQCIHNKGSSRRDPSRGEANNHGQNFVLVLPEMTRPVFLREHRSFFVRDVLEPQTVLNMGEETHEIIVQGK